MACSTFNQDGARPAHAGPRYQWRCAPNWRVAGSGDGFAAALGSGLFALQVFAASTLLAVLLLWGAQNFDWVAMRAHSAKRVGLLALLMCAAAVLYFGVLRVAGLQLRHMLRR